VKNKLLSFIELLRVEQWLKNTFVFLPLFFSGNLMNMGKLLITLEVAILYCFVCSSIYCFNDIWDINFDRLHPQKSKRPLASGTVKFSEAFIIIGILLSVVFISLFFLHLPESVSIILLSYLLLNVAYTLYLKHIAIIDVSIIATGFVLRVIIGGFASGILISHWIILMTFLLTLFLSFAKRRDDLLIFQKTGYKMRVNLHRYSLEFLNTSMSIVATISIVAYIQYTLAEETIARYHTESLYFTAFFVLLGILKYLQITLVDNQSGSPTKILLKDRFIQFMIIGWGLLFSYFIYFKNLS
jgi:decaprenyl-phosphate phosphoribosyltransferase